MGLRLKEFGLLLLRREVEVKVGLGKCVQIISETGRGFQDPDYLLISSANNYIKSVFLYLKQSHCVNVIAVNLSPGNLMIPIISLAFCNNSGCLVFGNAYQKMAGVIPLDGSYLVGVSVARFSKNPPIFGPFPNHNCPSVVKSNQNR